MNSLRTRRLPVALILLALILFNGLACSFGHGQMLKAFAAGGTAGEQAADCDSHHGMPAMGEHHAAMPASGESSDMNGMSMPMFEDCSFAATLTLALVFFVALGWLQRRRQPRISVPYAWHLTPLRHCSSGLNPHAP